MRYKSKSMVDQSAAQCPLAGEDAWVIHLFDDVAVKFEINGKEVAEYGKIMRMRKRDPCAKSMDRIREACRFERSCSLKRCVPYVLLLQACSQL